MLLLGRLQVATRCDGTVPYMVLCCVTTSMIRTSTMIGCILGYIKVPIVEEDEIK